MSEFYLKQTEPKMDDLTSEGYLKNVKEIEASAGANVVIKDANGNAIINTKSVTDIIELINSKLNTVAKEILAEFTFGASGAIAIKTDNDNGIWISPTGILAKKAGVNTFALETDGDATFSGTLSAASGTIGTVTGGILQTALSGYRIRVNGNTNKIELLNGDTVVATIYADAGGSLILNTVDDIYLTKSGVNQFKFDSSGNLNFAADGKKIAWAGGRDITGNADGFEMDGHTWPSGDRQKDLGGYNNEWRDYVGNQIHLTNEIWADDYNYNSDEKIKKNVATIDRALDKILNLRGISFEYKKNDKKSIGFIAQEIEPIFPELVKEADAIIDEGVEKEVLDYEEKDEEGKVIKQTFKKVREGKKWEKIKTVSYGKLIPVLVEAIKEQQGQIEELKKLVKGKEINKV